MRNNMPITFESPDTYENYLQYHREYMRQWRSKHLERSRKTDRVNQHKRPKDERYRCRYLYNSAVRSGRIKKPTACSRCGTTERITAHHADYTKPLEFIGLCYVCHGIISRRRKYIEDKACRTVQD